VVAIFNVDTISNGQVALVSEQKWTREKWPLDKLPVSGSPIWQQLGRR